MELTDCRESWRGLLAMEEGSIIIPPVRTAGGMDCALSRLYRFGGSLSSVSNSKCYLGASKSLSK